MFYDIINYRHVSINFVINIRVALQTYLEYSKLQKCVSETTQSLGHLL